MRKLGSSTDSSSGAPACGSTNSPGDGTCPRDCSGTARDTPANRFNDRAANSHYDEGRRAGCYDDAGGTDSWDQYADHAHY